MGIYIYLEVSFSVTQKEWEAVYLETLELVKAFPLCEVIREESEDKSGCRTQRSRERALDEEGSIGWRATGDLDTMTGAEEFILPRRLFPDWEEEELEETEAYDADTLMGLAAYECIISYHDKRCRELEKIWAGNTLGRKYHTFILAVACLIADRLGKKASVYGNITAGQCKKAVRLANEHLSCPIKVPPQCDLKRFAERIVKMPLSGSEAMELFMRGYIGKVIEEIGVNAALCFSEEQIESYWIPRLKWYPVGSSGYQEVVNDYFTTGFELAGFCYMAKPLEPEEAITQYYEDVITSILDLRLHHKKTGGDRGSAE